MRKALFSLNNLKVESFPTRVEKWLTDNLSSDISKVDLLDDLKNEFHCGSRVLEDRQSCANQGIRT
jgi:hypothetical protein